MKKLQLAFFLVTIMTSCIKDDYSLEASKIKYSPEVAAPLLSSSIEVRQILSELDDQLDTNENKLLEFRFSNEIYSLALSEFISIPNDTIDFEFQLEPLSLEDIPTFQKDITLESVIDDDVALKNTIDNYKLIDSCDAQFPHLPSIDIDPVNFPINDATFENAQFSEGKLLVEIRNGWLTPLNDVVLSLKNASNDSLIGLLNYGDIQPGDSSTKEIDLAGKTVESNIVGEFLSIGIGPTTSKTECASYSDAITVTVNSSDLEIVSGSAVFPNREVINETVVSSLGLTSGEELNNIELKSADLIVQVDYGIEEAAKLYIELPYAKIGGNSFIDSIPIGPGPTSVNRTLDLSGYTLDLTRGGMDKNTIEASIRGKIVSSGSFVDFDTSNSVTAQIIMSKVEPLYIEGYFGNQPLDIASETFDFDLGEAEIFEKINFANPTITLGFHNTFGLPIEISDLGLTMKRDNDSSSLSTSGVFPFEISGSEIRGESKTSELILGSSTNISELINLWPNEVTTDFSGGLNPDGWTDKNFALDTSKVDITLDLTIPIYGTVTDFNITDTIKIDSSLSQIFEFVKRASLRTNVNNGLPLEGIVKFYITDENYVVLDSLECSDGNNVLIEAAEVDPGTGDVINNGFRQADLVADEDDVNFLKTAGNNLIISATLSTANSGNNVKIYTDYSIEIKMGILAKVLYESAEIESSNSGNN
tara:strand:- start:3766 stop:5877 length:2112 start_codon:yes stop_codon:yes gene_type:complete